MPDILGIIADDLTGAGDTAVQFALRGIPSAVVFRQSEGPVGALVLAMDSDSRGLSANEAMAATAKAASEIRAAGATRFYKKSDSTLRGHLANELDSMMDAIGAKMALVAPAYPANGRITAGGYHLVHGIPVAETEAANDPVMPVTKSHLPSLLKSGLRRPVGILELGMLESGENAVNQALDAMAREGVEVVACDSTTDRHLFLLAKYLESHPQVVGCGSAGLARAIAGCMAPKDASPVGRLQGGTGPSLGLPVLTVAGSRTRITAAQIQALAGTGACILQAESEGLLSPVDEYRNEMARRIARSLDSGCDTVLYLPVDLPLMKDASGRLADALGAVTSMALAISGACGGLVMTGGDTARAVCRHLNVEAIDLTDELSPAVPAGSLIGGRFSGLQVVTKGGGCGDTGILAAAAEYLKKGSG